ncbi:MAG: hypothetical protein PT977_04120 [Acidobacteriota bacterium]|nr:hypothetical protein [Acidobacteriota bacterium]
MRCRAIAAAFALVLLSPAARAAGPARWGVADEARIAAEAASWAPPDFKRQLAKHSRRLMQGVSDAAAADTGTRDAAAHRAAAARGARAVAAAIRRHMAFDEVAYQAGAIVHELALALPPPQGAATDFSKTARFLGFPAEPFAAPETLAAAPLPAATARERYDAAVTLSSRLLAWIWKTAGGDVSFVKKYPESKGPYVP